MNHIVLYQPEIPQNTGAIARTCAATGSALHLIRPLGFDISESAVRRAGLDYWHLVDVTVWDSLDEWLEANGDKKLFLLTTKAPACYTEADFTGECALLFGRETSGLPEEVRERFRSQCLRIPMRPQARSLNLASSAGIVLYEALRQQGYPGLMDRGVMSLDE